MNINKYLIPIITTGILAVLFTPLIVTNSFFFPFITGKNFFFRIIVEIIFGAWVILAVTDPAYRPRKSWILWLLTGFVVVIGIADIFSPNAFKSFWSNYERMEGYITILHLFAFYLVLSTTLNTQRLWNWFWNTSIGVSLLIVLVGLLQIAGKVTINQGGVRLDATFGNATYLAVYMLIHIFITAYIVFSRRMFLFYPFKNIRYKYALGGIIMVLQAVILYFTATRGAVLGFIFSIILISVLLAVFEKNRPRLRKTAFGVIGIVAVLIIGFLAVKNTNFVQESPVLSRFATISLSDRTTLSRFSLWNMALKGFAERPILGWGQESFNYVFNEYYDPALYGQEQWFDRTHNVVFDWLIAGGILGLGTYLGFFVVLLWAIWRSGGNTGFTLIEKSLLTGLLAGYFIHNLFVFDNITSYIMFFAVAAYITYRTQHEHAIITTRTYPSLDRAVAPAMLVVTIGLVYIANAAPVSANKELIRALTPRAPQSQIEQQLPFSGDVTSNLESFKKVISYNTVATSEAREQLMSVAEQIGSVQYPIQGRDEFLQYTQQQLEEQIKSTPDDARYYVLYGAYLNRIGQTDLAIQNLTKAVELSPNKQAILFELGYTYITKQDYPKALENFKKAYDLEPDFETARLMYAVGLILNKQNTEAQEILNSFDPTFVINSDQIVQAYYLSKQYDKVIEMWRERANISPNDPQVHVSLAAAYLLVNNRTAAIAELQRAIELAPNFKEQGEAYIKEIRAGRNPAQTPQ